MDRISPYAAIVEVAQTDPRLAYELALTARLIRGYSDINKRDLGTCVNSTEKKPALRIIRYDGAAQGGTLS